MIQLGLVFVLLVQQVMYSILIIERYIQKAY